MHVNVVPIDEENRDAIEKQIATVRNDLTRAGWHRVVSVHEKEHDVAVFVRNGANDSIEGLAVTAVEADRQAVVVNVVGSINPDQLAELAARLDLPKLPEIAKTVHP